MHGAPGEILGMAQQGGCRDIQQGRDATIKLGACHCNAWFENRIHFCVKILALSVGGDLVIEN